MQHVSRNWTTTTREADFCGSAFSVSHVAFSARAV